MIAPRGLVVRAALLAAVGITSIAGCGDGYGLARRYSVSGKVTYKGQPVEKGRINFVPEAVDGRPAAGEIENGSYSLTTMAPSDGALPGKYKVTIVSKEIDDTEMKKIANGGQFHHDKAFAKAVKNAKALVPSKYALADTSGLEKTVAESSNYFDFDLAD